MSVDPGEGYRLLRVGELCCDGDEFLFNNAWYPVDAEVDIGSRHDDCWCPTRRKRTPTDDSLNRIRTAMQNHPNWADILFGELTEPLRTDLKLVLEHYLGEKT